MKHLIVKAHTDSEWDSVSAALVELNDDSISKLRKIRNAVENFNTDGLSFNRASFFFYGAEFKISESGQYDEMETSCTVVEDLDMSDYSDPESPIDSCTIDADKDSFRFTAYGKHTGEKFYSETVSFEDFDKLIAQ
jgi:hypothetical protein